MALKFWPFHRSKEAEALPDEVKEFYESGRKQKAGMAWLLALGTLVVTVLLAVALFFAGRWVFDKIAGDDEPSSPQTTQNVTEQPTKEDQSETFIDEGDPDAEGNDQQGSSSANTTAPSPNPGDITPTTGDDGLEIPDTGPGPGGLQ